MYVEKTGAKSTPATELSCSQYEAPLTVKAVEVLGLVHLVPGAAPGAVMHRLLMERQPVTPEWSEAVVDVIVRGLARP